jgi:hypothetical protein
MTRTFPSKRLTATVALGLALGVPAAVGAAPTPLEEDYNQWKQALGTNAATAPQHLTALPGFTVELLRSAQPGEGSWVALAFDPRGRVVIAREDRGLLRLTLPDGAGQPVGVETINTNLLECRGLLFAYDALYANANNSKGLYRLRDTDGDDQFDEVKLLRATPGGVGRSRRRRGAAARRRRRGFAVAPLRGGPPAAVRVGPPPLQRRGEDAVRPSHPHRPRRPRVGTRRGRVTQSVRH